jgi:hypothetical protein
MLSNLPPRVLGLAIGAGAVVAGLVIALLGVVFGVGRTGLVAAGLATAAIGLLVAIVSAVGFALHGSVRSGRKQRKRT